MKSLYSAKGEYFAAPGHNSTLADKRLHLDCSKRAANILLGLA
jgi:hypothetical protein